ncbi:HEAT repeat protein [Streptomyces sp. SLBN-118]|uniref:HEAT repeat domain-containing protein n=1 Tax=Streptomyces sp. SLBN-118 TaxID=2768454 RepID=UPI0011532D34|nr:HEAT repeat domain-containing protein [Streptomyces sp. SLBN-118]TQK44075.1 HEAT repeat protein [Streptomyces sp. SLBN-118]
MIATGLVTGALLCLTSVVVLLGVLIVGLRVVRRYRHRRRDRIVAPVRGVLLELLCAEEDEQTEALDRLTELDDRTWGALEPTVAVMFGKITGQARTALIQLFERRGATAHAVADLGRRGAARRGRAAEVLGQLRHRPAAPPLCRLLNDHDPEVRLVAARALGLIGEPSVVPQLLECLYGPRTVPPAVVTRALTSFGPEALRSIAAGLHHPEPLVRAVAIETLGAIGGVSRTAEIARALSEDSHAEVRIKAARALGRLGMPDGLEPLLTAVDPGQPVALRTVAAGALGSLGAVAATARLRELLGDPDDHVAATAARSLLRLGEAGSADLRAAAEGRPGDRAAAQARGALAESAAVGASSAPTAEVVL